MMRGLVTLILISALLGGGITHTTVSHEHGHAHSAEESSIWATLHSSLRHEEKSVFFVLSESFLLVAIAIIVASTAAAHTHTLVQLIAMRRDPYARDALRRGIYRYRVFG